jgi:rubrerythrin
MRDPNSTLGAAALTALKIMEAKRRVSPTHAKDVKEARRRAFEGPGRHIAEPRDKARDKARAEREAEAATWIQEVRSRKR